MPHIKRCFQEAERHIDRGEKADAYRFVLCQFLDVVDSSTGRAIVHGGSVLKIWMHILLIIWVYNFEFLRCTSIYLSFKKVIFLRLQI